jgi:hypothetical protein
LWVPKHGPSLFWVILRRAGYIRSG